MPPIRLIMNLSSHKLLFLLVALCALFISHDANAQVSLPERNPVKLTFRGGAMSNNGDLAAQLKNKSDGELGRTVDLNYSAIGEAELGIDLLKFRGSGLNIAFAGMYAHPELIATDYAGTATRVGLTQLEIARASLNFTFNGTDPYTMFELPYHSNKEAVLGLTAMIIRTEKTALTSYATDTLGIDKIAGEYCQAMGINFGWNWRLGQSGFVLGISGEFMWAVNKSRLVDVTTKESSRFDGDRLDFAPRIITAGLGYHF